MTKYENLKRKKDRSERLALFFKKRNQTALAQFYANAAVGFSKKISQLTVGEAEKESE